MKLLALAAVASLMASPALAQTSITNWSNGNYDVTGSAVGEDNPGCIMTSEFEIEGRSPIDFAVTFDGDRVLFSLTSVGWSAAANEEYEGFHYFFPKSETMFNGGVTVGHVHQYINKGFVTAFDADFLDRLAAEPRLMVGREVGEDMTIVADLNLTGTATAVTALRRCTEHVVAREAARIRRESRNDYIAKDPFAT